MALRFAILIGVIFAWLAPAGLAAQTSDSLYAEFQRREGRLFDAGWRMARANRAICARTSPSIGLLIHDANNYGSAGDIRRVFSLASDIGVQAVAKGSPAHKAGVTPNRSIFAIDLAQIAQDFAPTRPAVDRTLQIEDAIQSSLEDGRVGISFSDRGGETTIEGVQTCDAKFRLTPDAKIYAGPRTVFLGGDFMAFTLPEDAFAAAVAHELAHVLLDHPRRKEAEDWSWRQTRQSERTADRMMPWLLWNAGYDPRGAATFMREWGPKHGGGLLRKRTHDGWDERLAMIVAETATLSKLIKEKGWKPGEADWAARFASSPD